MGEKDIAFLITTRNRRDSCQRLVDAISAYGDVFIINDGCSYVIRGSRQLIRHEYYGKRLYWKTVNQLFSFRTPHKYYMMLPDDFMPLEGMVEKAISIWESIRDKDKICLNLSPDRIGTSCWTSVIPVDKGNVFKTGWVDMCFLCEDRFFEVLGDLPQTTISESSGVGSYISKFFIRHPTEKYTIYHSKEMLVIPQEEHYTNSQMQHEIRRNSNSKGKRTPLPRGRQKRL